MNWKYDDFVTTFTNWGQPYGSYFYGEHGSLHVDRQGYTMQGFTDQRIKEPRFKRIEVEAPDDYPSLDTSLGNHVRNLLDCIKTREKPVANIDIGFNSTLPTLLALASIKTGKTYGWDGKTAQVIG